MVTFLWTHLHLNGIVPADMISPRNIRYALALLVSTAIIGIVAAISFQGSRAPLPEQVSRQIPHNIDVSLNDARFSEMREGTTVWELVASQADYDKSGEKVSLDRVAMTFFNSRPNGKVTVTADKGEYANASRDVYLRGRVHVVSESGMSFDTDSLDYIARKGIFRTDDKVQFQHERIKLTAIGMELDAKNETSRFFKMIEADISSPYPGNKVLDGR